MSLLQDISRLLGGEDKAAQGRLQEDLLTSLLIMAWMVEARDPYTGGHLWRVSRLLAADAGRPVPVATGGPVSGKDLVRRRRASMTNCKDVTHLLSESQDRKLRLAEKIQVKMHLAMCQGCTRYQQQLNFIRRACRAFARSEGGPEDQA